MTDETDQGGMDESPEEAPVEDKAFGWGQLLGAVNLHDFADMVRGEGTMIGTMFRRAFATLPRLPFGPLVFAGYMLFASLRLFLLLVVVVVFGGAIAVLSVIRGLRRQTGGG